MEVLAHTCTLACSQARIAMIPQPVLAAFYATAIAIVDTLLVCFGPVGRLSNRHVRV